MFVSTSIQSGDCNSSHASLLPHPQRRQRTELCRQPKAHRALIHFIVMDNNQKAHKGGNRQPHWLYTSLHECMCGISVRALSSPGGTEEAFWMMFLTHGNSSSWTWDPHLDFKGVRNTEGTHFGCLYPRSRSFGQYPKFTTIGGDGSVEGPLDQELRLSPSLFLHRKASFHLSILLYIFPPLLNKNLRYSNPGLRNQTHESQTRYGQMIQAIGEEQLG